MNYRHGYHAGNHTEVFKHTALVALLDLLGQKSKPMMVLDTHAGAGLYDLRSAMALKTGEAGSGIHKLLGRVHPALEPYVSLVREVGGPDMARYPGSPEIIRRLLRDGDRLVACELHPEDIETLRVHLSHDKRVAIHHRDGYAAIRAFVPPPERRGLVFIDPPFERTDEASELVRTLVEGLAKWPTGTFAAWFPIKDMRVVDRLSAALVGNGLRKLLLTTFLPYPIDGTRLAGSGLFTCNPPWRFDDRMAGICESLGDAFPGSRSSVEWLADEDRGVNAPGRTGVGSRTLSRARRP